MGHQWNETICKGCIVIFGEGSQMVLSEDWIRKDEADKKVFDLEAENKDWHDRFDQDNIECRECEKEWEAELKKRDEEIAHLTGALVDIMRPKYEEKEPEQVKTEPYFVADDSEPSKSGSFGIHPFTPETPAPLHTIHYHCWNGHSGDYKKCIECHPDKAPSKDGQIETPAPKNKEEPCNICKWRAGCPHFGVTTCPLYPGKEGGK